MDHGALPGNPERRALRRGAGAACFQRGADGRAAVASVDPAWRRSVRALSDEERRAELQARRDAERQKLGAVADTAATVAQASDAEKWLARALEAAKEDPEKLQQLYQLFMEVRIFRNGETKILPKIPRALLQN